MIRQDNIIQGAQLQDGHAKIVQYADDSTCFLRNSSSIQPLIDLLLTFQKWSGLRINRAKSSILFPGSTRDKPKQIAAIPIVREVKILGVWILQDNSISNNLSWNFNPILNKIKATCESWTNRSLSLKGKITVANSLLVSLLQYQCSCIYTPPQVFKEYKKIVGNFIWNGKRPKISYNTLAQPISNGGLNLMDLETRVKSSLLQWPKRLVLSPASNTSLTLSHLVRSGSINDVFSYNWPKAPDGVKHDPFYTQMFAHWIQIHGTDPLNEKDIRRELVWNNRWITSNGKTLYRPSWQKKGIRRIQDLCNDKEGRLYSHTELTERYQVRCTFLDALQIRLSIPLHWRSAISPNCLPTPELPSATGISVSLPGEQPRDLASVGSKAVYSAITLDKDHQSAAFARWSEDTADSLKVNNQAEWSVICLSPFKTTRETKIQTLQYKILNRILPCNSYLKQLRLRQDESCNYCDQRDSIAHFLFLCPVVQIFWSRVCSWFNNSVGLQLQSVDDREFVFGSDVTTSKGKIINFILLQTKYFVHRQKLFHQGDLRLVHFLQELKAKLQCEKFISFQEGKSARFRKWEAILTALG